MRTSLLPASNVVEKDYPQCPLIPLGLRGPSWRMEAEFPIEIQGKGVRGAFFTEGGLDVLVGSHCFRRGHFGARWYTLTRVTVAALLMCVD